MTIANIPSVVNYTATGTTAVFAVPFTFFEDSDLYVTLGGVAQTLGVDYTVSGQDVVFTAAPTGAVVIRRLTPYSQTTDLSNQGVFLAESLEKAIDRAVAQIQQLKDGVLTAAGVVQSGDSSAATVIGTGTTTARSLANRFGEIINVKDFGAVGDGIADDTAAIQAAIVAASRVSIFNADWGVGEGGTVFFPRGVYLITAPLAWTADGVHLEGEGSSNATSIKVALASNPATTDAIQIGVSSGGTPARRAGLRRLSVYADDTTKCRDLVSIDGATWWRIEDVNLYQAGRYGLTIGGTLDGYAANLRTSYCGDSGVFIKADSAGTGHTTTDFHHLYSHNNQKYGVLLERSHVTNFFGSIIEFNGAGGDATQGDGIRMGTTVDISMEINLFGAYFESNLGWDIHTGTAAAGSNFHYVSVYGYFADAAIAPAKASTYGFFYGSRARGAFVNGRLSSYTAALNHPTFSLDSTCRISIFGTQGEPQDDTNAPVYRSGSSINEYSGGVIQWAATGGDSVSYGRHLSRLGGPGASASVALGRFNGMPSSGTWATGDMVLNQGTAQGAEIGYICTAGGSPGTWAPIGFRPSVSGGLDTNSNPTLTSPIEPIVRATTAITADRTLTLSQTNARRGQSVRVVRTATGAFNLTVWNGATGALKAMPVSSWADYAFDGSNWVLTGYGAL